MGEMECVPSRASMRTNEITHPEGSPMEVSSLLTKFSLVAVVVLDYFLIAFCLSYFTVAVAKANMTAIPGCQFDDICN